ncbi:MAG: DUF1552 domain-containing protein [Myxococcaceae bacterium]|nr:DUF1552 domain-containing protein [Myxococcaceae bacterium]
MKKWEISRRTLLRGAGAVMALPLLEQMLPSISRAQAMGAPPPRRIVAFYVPCGIHMADFTPSSTGSSYTLSKTLTPLGPYKAKFNVLTGLANLPARPDGPGDHASGTGAFLTNAHPFKTEGTDIRNGISMDQVAANQLRAYTRFPSLELGTDGGGTTGNCDSGYSCAYARNISWTGPQTPMPKETNPALVFDRLFGAESGIDTAAQIAKRKKYKQSIIDFVREDAQALDKKLGATDRKKMDEYLTSVRELELRIQAIDEGPQCTPGNAPGAPTDIREKTRAMLDMLALAFQCDQTRVATFMLGNAGSNRVYDFLGLTDGHHTYSHHQNDPANFAALQKIDQWEIEQLAYLFGKLDAIKEPDGTALDNSLIFFSSEIEDGNAHRHTNLPIILGGSAGGAIATGRHVKYTNNPSVGQLFISMLNAVGVPTQAFGEATSPLPNL